MFWLVENKLLGSNIGTWCKNGFLKCATQKLFGCPQESHSHLEHCFSGNIYIKTHTLSLPWTFEAQLGVVSSRPVHPLEKGERF